MIVKVSTECVHVTFQFHHFIYFISQFKKKKKKLHILQLDWPADSNASLGGPVDQLNSLNSQIQN